MEMDTSTPEPGLRLCLSCFEKHSSCCVVFMPRLGYCSEWSFWKYILTEKLHNEHSCLPEQDPGCCSLAGLSGLTLVMLGYGSSPADCETSNQLIFILLNSSWRSKVGLLTSTGAFELPLSWSCQGQAGATYPLQLLGP